MEEQIYTLQKQMEFLAILLSRKVSTYNIILTGISNPINAGIVTVYVPEARISSTITITPIGGTGLLFNPLYTVDKRDGSFDIVENTAGGGGNNGLTFMWTLINN